MKREFGLLEKWVRAWAQQFVVMMHLEKGMPDFDAFIEGIERKYGIKLHQDDIERIENEIVDWNSFINEAAKDTLGGLERDSLGYPMMDEMVLLRIREMAQV
jgi:hypothetical protein